MLHRSTSCFIGMKKRENFIATRIIDGIFIALSNKGKLYSWDLITGKLRPNLANSKIFNEYKEYEIYTWTDDDLKITDNVYKKEYYRWTLLKKKTPIENFDEKEYFGDIEEGKLIKNQKSYN